MWLHLHRANTLFLLGGESPEGAALSSWADGAPRQAPLQGLLRLLRTHWPTVWQSHGRQAVSAHYGSSEILKPHTSWDFLSAQGACCNFPGGELMKMRCGLFLAPSGVPFQRQRNPQTLGCY